MSLRFNQVFVGLLALSFFSAFLLPARYTNPIRNIQSLFYPVAGPARAIGAVLHGRFARPVKDDRSVVDIRTENAQLRQMVSELTAKLQELQRINADRQLVEVRSLCTPVAVVGSDPGVRDSIAIKSGTMENIQRGMPVLYARGLVGKIERSGPGGSQVQLVTDRTFRAVGEFRRYITDQGTLTYKAIGQTVPIVEGAGEGVMRITNVPIKETEGDDGLRAGDTVVLNDPEWGHAVGQQLGVVDRIDPRASAPLFADIRVRPVLKLAELREVMVMNKPH